MSGLEAHAFEITLYLAAAILSAAEWARVNEDRRSSQLPGGWGLSMIIAGLSWPVTLGLAVMRWAHSSR